LQNVKVSIEPKMDGERSLRMIIEAVMVADDVSLPVSFRTIYDSKTGMTEINAE